jgi:hypothetical protein
VGVRWWGGSGRHGCEVVDVVVVLGNCGGVVVVG